MVQRQKLSRPSFRPRVPIPRGSEGIMTLVGGAIIALFVVLAFFPHLVTPQDPIRQDTTAVLNAPSWEHPMGTDQLGRDVLSRVVYGTRVALLVSVFSVLTSLVFGLFLGSLAGYYGGKFDRVASFFMDTIYAFPGLVLTIAIVVMLGPSVLNMAIAISFWYIPTYYRIIRSEVLSTKSKVFVRAARALGATDFHIIFRCILPNVVSSTVVLASLNVADVVLATATVGFLGLGLPPPSPDWGTDLSIGHPFMLSGKWWLATFPGMMIVLITVGFNLFGEGLSEMMNPELRIR